MAVLFLSMVLNLPGSGPSIFNWTWDFSAAALILSPGLSACPFGLLPRSKYSSLQKTISLTSWNKSGSLFLGLFQKLQFSLLLLSNPIWGNDGKDASLYFYLTVSRMLRKYLVDLRSLIQNPNIEKWSSREQIQLSCNFHLQVVESYTSRGWNFYLFLSHGCRKYIRPGWTEKIVSFMKNTKIALEKSGSRPALKKKDREGAKSSGGPYCSKKHFQFVSFLFCSISHSPA